MPLSQLAQAFALAERDFSFMPVPAELRRLAGIHPDNALIATDRAWKWVMEYLRDHGATGEPKPGKLRHEVDRIVLEEETPAPEIPAEIRYTLEVLGGTVRFGLERIQATEPVQFGWLRREFDAAYQRASSSDVLGDATGH